jgi:hypothetical protein
LAFSRRGLVGLIKSATLNERRRRPKLTLEPIVDTAAIAPLKDLARPLT